jgi:CrcB protein
MVTRLLWVMLAGAVGTGTRYGVGLVAFKALGPAWPWGTFVVNVAGCFLMSIVGYCAARAVITEDTRVVLATGFMGGLTTYSAFNAETLALADSRSLVAGALNVGGTLAACLVAGLLGLALARALFGA